MHPKTDTKLVEPLQYLLLHMIPGHTILSVVKENKSAILSTMKGNYQVNPDRKRLLGFIQKQVIALTLREKRPPLVLILKRAIALTLREKKPPLVLIQKKAIPRIVKLGSSLSKHTMRATKKACVLTEGAGMYWQSPSLV